LLLLLVVAIVVVVLLLQQKTTTTITSNITTTTTSTTITTIITTIDNLGYDDNTYDDNYDEGDFPENYGLNALSYGIKIWTDLSSVLSQYMRLIDGRTGRQTDRIFIARQRLHNAFHAVR